MKMTLAKRTVDGVCRKGNSPHFDSFNVCGDKITIHKSIINRAIKQVKNDIDPFESEDRVAGRLDILDELLEAFDTHMSNDNRTKETIGRLKTAFAQVMDLYNEEYKDDPFLYEILSNIEKQITRLIFHFDPSGF